MRGVAALDPPDDYLFFRAWALQLAFVGLMMGRHLWAPSSVEAYLGVLPLALLALRLGVSLSLWCLLIVCACDDAEAVWQCAPGRPEVWRRNGSAVVFASCTSCIWAGYTSRSFFLHLFVCGSLALHNSMWVAAHTAQRAVLAASSVSIARSSVRVRRSRAVA